MRPHVQHTPPAYMPGAHGQSGVWNRQALSAVPKATSYLCNRFGGAIDWPSRVRAGRGAVNGPAEGGIRHVRLVTETINGEQRRKISTNSLLPLFRASRPAE